MTIAAGFCASDGILLCADTLYTGVGANLHGTKLFTSDIPSGKVAFTCSGNAEFAQATMQKCINQLLATDRDEISECEDIRAIVEHTIDGEYRRLVYDRPDRDQRYHDFQLLMAAWTPASGVSLFTTFETVTRRCHDYACIGAGVYLGHYLIRPLYQPGMRLAEIALPITYAFGKAKEYVEGCGGHTNFVVLRSDGSMDDVSWHITEPIERALKEYELRTRAFIFSVADVDPAFDSSLSTLTAGLRNIRATIGSERDDERSLIRRWLQLFSGPSIPPI